MSIVDGRDDTGLTQAEMQAIFRLVIRRAMPATSDDVNESEAALFVAASILKGHGFDPSAVLTLMAQMWSRIEGDDVRAFIFNVVDQRYVGWNYRGRSILVDMNTGEELPHDRPLLPVGESTAYNPYVLLARRVREVQDAASHTPRDEAAEGGDGLGGSPVVRDDASPSIP